MRERNDCDRSSGLNIMEEIRSLKGVDGGGERLKGEDASSGVTVAPDN